MYNMSIEIKNMTSRYSENQNIVRNRAYTRRDSKNAAKIERAPFQKMTGKTQQKHSIICYHEILQKHSDIIRYVISNYSSFVYCYTTYLSRI